MWRLYGSLRDNFTGFELTQIIRQKDDRRFAELLVRLRPKGHTAEDIEMLSKRIITTSDDSSYPSEALHVFATNKLVNNHNYKTIYQLMCIQSELKILVRKYILDR